jgi:hypothetical protein
VRARAADLLARAAATLREAAAAYQHTYVPLPTRENPFPPAEALEPARRAEALAKKLTECAERIRGVPFPDPDRLWRRLRRGGSVSLLEYDRLLVGHAQEAASVADQVTAENIKALRPEVAVSALTEVTTVLAERSAWLAGV